MPGINEGANRIGRSLLWPIDGLVEVNAVHRCDQLVVSTRDTSAPYLHGQRTAGGSSRRVDDLARRFLCKRNVAVEVERAEVPLMAADLFVVPTSRFGCSLSS
jgi:hypothetical protein